MLLVCYWDVNRIIRTTEIYPTFKWYIRYSECMDGMCGLANWLNMKNTGPIWTKWLEPLCHILSHMNVSNSRDMHGMVVYGCKALRVWHSHTNKVLRPQRYYPPENQAKTVVADHTTDHEKYNVMFLWGNMSGKGHLLEKIGPPESIIWFSIVFRTLFFYLTKQACPIQRVQAVGSIHAINILTSDLFTANAMWTFMFTFPKYGT